MANRRNLYFLCQFHKIIHTYSRHIYTIKLHLVLTSNNTITLCGNKIHIFGGLFLIYCKCTSTGGNAFNLEIRRDFSLFSANL